MKRFFSFIIYVLVVTSIFAQQMMHLGNTSFVRPSEQMSITKRSFSVKTSVRGARVFAKVGGIAFIQEALPAESFNFKNITLNCDIVSQKSSVMIDGYNYNIPLSNWMLQPIVNYANDTCNAVVTLYGENEVKIMYHPAFVDKLLGLRLLQTDMMLAGNRLKVEDRACLPEDERNIPILANSEKKIYDSIDKGKQNEAIFNVACLMDKYVEDYGYWDTYIYTDRDQSIKFSVNNGKFTIVGEPYYLFSKRYFNQVDTLNFIQQTDFYKEINGWYMNDYSNIQKINVKYKFNKQSNQSIAENRIIAQIPTNDLITLFLDKDTAKVHSYNKLIISSYNNIKSTIDEIFKINNNFRNSDGDVAYVMQKVRDYKDNLGWMSLPFVKIWSDLLINAHPESNAAKKLADSMSKYYFSNTNTYLVFMTLNSLPYTEEKINFSDKMREKQSSLRAMNPTVYNAAVATCQWSAFFRYMKKRNPANWRKFVYNVNKLKYDAPTVWTPIDCTIYN